MISLAKSLLKRAHTKRKALFIKLLSLSTLGLEMGICVGAGFFIGNYIDKYFKTIAPFGTIFFIIAGFGAAIKSFIRAIKKIKKEFDEDQS